MFILGLLPMKAARTPYGTLAPALPRVMVLFGSEGFSPLLRLPRLTGSSAVSVKYVGPPVA